MFNLLELVAFSFIIDKSICQITGYSNLQTERWCLIFTNWIYLYNIHLASVNYLYIDEITSV